MEINLRHLLLGDLVKGEITNATVSYQVQVGGTPNSDVCDEKKD